MKNYLPYFAIIFILLVFPNSDFAQAPSLGSAAGFVIFTITGAVGNTGISHITGNVGANTGAVTSFGNVNGVMHNNDAATLLCANDLTKLYNQLDSTTPTANYPSGAAVIGYGQVINAGVYKITGATSLIGTLILDGQGDANAVFIFQIEGAFTTSASSQIILSNGAQACNVFWKVTGAASMAAGTSMKGNIVCSAAIDIGAGGTLEGRALSTGGAVSVYGVLLYTPNDFTAPILAGPVAPFSGSTTCFALFSINGMVTNSGATIVTGDIGTNLGSISGYNPIYVDGTIHATPGGSTAACDTDLLILYNHLNSLSHDIELLYPAQFGNSLVLTPHIYLLNAAAILTDTVFLNAEGNINGVFVIKINGALTTSANAKVVLLNGAQAKNVFWKIEGAVTINTNSDFKGTIVCNNGAVVLNTGTTMEGSLLTTNGAINTNATAIKATTPGPPTTIHYPLSAYCPTAGTAFSTLSGTADGIYSSTTGLVLNAITGAITLGTSTSGVYTVFYTFATAGGCSPYQASTIITIATAGTWTGSVDTDWNTGGNWVCGVIPSSITDVILPAGLGSYPVIIATANVKNITIQNNASLKVQGTLQIAGIISNAGSLDVSAGTINMNGSSLQAIPANAFLNNHVLNLTINNDVVLEGQDTIGGILSFGSIHKTLFTGDMLTLESTAISTSSVAPMPTDLAGVATSFIVGSVSVQRYIPKRRAWRMLTSPLSNTGNIYSSWQNNGVYQSGKGVLITGASPSIANGLDTSSYNNFSMKTFSETTQLYVNTIDTKSVNLSNNNGNADNMGYLIFIRGDRNPENTNVSFSNSTTLTSKGSLQTGKQQFTAASTKNKFTLMGNPYASPIDFNNIKRTRVSKRFYVWDPNLGLVGAYVVLDDLDNDGIYTKSILSSNQDKNIQSGQAFFVLTDTTGAASITYYEHSKSNTLSGSMFRPNTTISSFNVMLNLLANDGAVTVADAVVAEFNNNFNEGVDLQDAEKFVNINETIGLQRNGIQLAIERRPLINTAGDTLFLRLAKTTARNYQLVLSRNNIDLSLMATLEDQYTGIGTLLNTDGSTTINFNINGNAASAKPDRFRIVFRKLKTLPAIFTDVNAERKGIDIEVSWSISQQVNLKSYAVEKSVDGRSFITVNSQAVKGSTHAVYNWMDENAVSGNNFYRIRTVDLNDNFTYSKIIEINLAKPLNELVVYPNPVENGIISVQLNNLPTGKYSACLISSTGQILLTTELLHTNGNRFQPVVVPPQIEKGIYSLKITSADKLNSKAINVMISGMIQ